MKEAKRKISFWAWLKRQTKRNDPVGDLARDAMADQTRAYPFMRVGDEDPHEFLHQSKTAANFPKIEGLAKEL